MTAGESPAEGGRPARTVLLTLAMVTSMIVVIILLETAGTIHLPWLDHALARLSIAAGITIAVAAAGALATCLGMALRARHDQAARGLVPGVLTSVVVGLLLITVLPDHYCDDEADRAVPPPAPAATEAPTADVPAAQTAPAPAAVHANSIVPASPHGGRRAH